MENNSQNNKLLICILAAGKSRRMGQPKQLLHWYGESLLSHTIKQVKSLPADIVVVLGAYMNEIIPTLEPEIRIIKNKNWSSGIGTSIHLAVTYALKRKYNALCYTVCDNPNYHTRHYQQLVNKYKMDKDKIVYTNYKNTFGTPMIFPKIYFSELLNIESNRGAKKVVQNNIEESSCININTMFSDIDTLEQYEAMVRKTDRFTSLYD